MTAMLAEAGAGPKQTLLTALSPINRGQMFQAQALPQ